MKTDTSTALHEFCSADTPETSASAGDVNSHEEFFRLYVAELTGICPHDHAPLQLKLEHTFRVLENARFIAKEEHFLPLVTRACLLAALYHDISRFEQYRIWKTFRDHESCDHGELSVELVQRMNVMKKEPELENCVLTAIRLHNKRTLPEKLSETEHTVCSVIRDADRIDIMQIIDEHLSGKSGTSPDVITPFPDNPNLYSQSVIKAVLERKAASYADLKSVNDFRLLAAGWFYLMGFESSKRLTVQAGHARSLIEHLPFPYEQVQLQLLNDLQC